MDDQCPVLKPRDPPCGHPCPHALFQPLPPQPAPFPGIYLNAVAGAKGVYLTAGDTVGQAVPLGQVHHKAMGPRLSNTDKPRHPLARRGARKPRPTDPNAPGPVRALLHLTMKHTAQLPITLAGEKHFIKEGPTDDVIILGANTLAATTDAWDDAVGHPTARKNREKEKEDTLTPDLVDHLVQLTSPPEQHNRKTEGPKITDWTILDKPPNAPTMTLMCHQHIWWVAQWNTTGTRDRLHTFTPETTTATPLALGDRFSHTTQHSNHPLAHWLALKTAMHWTVDAPTTDSTLPATWLKHTRNLPAYVRKHGTTQAERWMSWPTKTERTLKHRTTNLQEHANKLRGMHQPREGQGPAYSIFHNFHNRNAPKPAAKPAPEQARPKPRPRSEGAGIPARRAKRPKPASKAAPVPSPPESPFWLLSLSLVLPLSAWLRLLVSLYLTPFVADVVVAVLVLVVVVVVVVVGCVVPVVAFMVVVVVVIVLGGAVIAGIVVLSFTAWRPPAKETQNIAPMRGSPTDSRICTKNV